MRVSRVGSWDSGTRSERPVPRLSNRISREKLASRSKKCASVGSSQAASTIRHPAGDVQHVARAVADHLVGDRHAIGGAHVVRGRHDRYFQESDAGLQPKSGSVVQPG